MLPDERVDKLYELMDIFAPTPVQVADWFINWNGAQILKDEFFDFIEKENE